MWPIAHYNVSKKGVISVRLKGDDHLVRHERTPIFWLGKCPAYYSFEIT